METLPRRTLGETAQVVEQYKSMVYGLALARLGSPADADDVFQEVFLAYHNSGKEFYDEEHRKAWLLRTTVNMIRRVLSAARRQKTVPLEEGEGMAAPFREVEENLVWQALQALPEEYREPIYLFYFEELSTQEIAQVLNLRPGAVRMRMSRGREMLRKTLKGGYFDEE